MQHTIFPSLIPMTGAFVEPLREVAIILNLEMSILLTKPKDKRKMMSKTLAELMEDSKKHVDAAINGSYSPTEARLRVLVKGKILLMINTARIGFSLSDQVILMQKEW
ncbi:hypothetical protein JYU34_000658 [Plutella xylostella]|uniref:Uncharacterized protein n=1 Tax=Plutella xylostella TaxID=51655 RepID=A0ABQ7R885_PLUXY|nr:hypothetical protein JYU34_000658 [Plutella xylostella]